MLAAWRLSEKKKAIIFRFSMGLKGEKRMEAREERVYMYILRNGLNPVQPSIDSEVQKSVLRDLCRI